MLKKEVKMAAVACWNSTMAYFSKSCTFRSTLPFYKPIPNRMFDAAPIVAFRLNICASLISSIFFHAHLVDACNY